LQELLKHVLQAYGVNFQAVSVVMVNGLYPPFVIKSLSGE